jgi:hypothetical protein
MNLVLLQNDGDDMKLYKPLFKEKDYKILASASSLNAIQKLISEYFYSPNIVLTPINDFQWSVANKKGVLNYIVELKKGRYIFKEK